MKTKQEQIAGYEAWLLEVEAKTVPAGPISTEQQAKLLPYIKAKIEALKVMRE
jgi:hypothetical protein